MQWFRFYGDAVNDPKVQSLTGEQFKFWVNLLCVASQNEGRIKISDLPFILRETKANVQRLIGDLKATSLLVASNQSSDHVAPHQWNKRQYKSDTSAERTRRHRDAKRDVTVTPPDTDAETEQNRTPKPPRGDFDSFYKSFPKRVGRIDAERAYMKAIKNTTHEEIMVGVNLYKKQVANTEKKYIQAPAAWLNKGRWMDEVDSSISKSDPIYTGVLV